MNEATIGAATRTIHRAQAIVEIVIYPDVVWLAARSLRGHSASYRTAS